MADYSSLGVYGGYYGQQQAQTETEMLKALAPIQVAEAGAKLQETQIEVQQKAFDLKAAESLFARQQDVLRMMSTQQNTRNSGDIAGQVGSEAEHAAHVMFQEAEAQNSQGFFKEGAELSEKASTILKNNSEVQSKNAEINSKMLTDVANSLQGVRTAAQWDEFRLEFPMLHPDEAKFPAVQEIMKRDFNAIGGTKGIEAMANHLTSMEVKARTAASLADAKARTATARKDDAWVDKLLPELIKTADARADYLSKAGAKGAKTTPSDITAMKKLILDRYPDADDNHAYNLARLLAQDANILAATGMDKASAQDQILNQTSRSYFAGIRSSREIPGASPGKPLVLPDTPDVSKMKDGMYYMTSLYGLRVWDAKSGMLLEVDPNALRAEGIVEEVPPDVLKDDQSE